MVCSHNTPKSIPPNALEAVRATRVVRASLRIQVPVTFPVYVSVESNNKLYIILGTFVFDLLEIAKAEFLVQEVAFRAGFNPGG